MRLVLAGVAQLVGASSYRLKGHRFDSRSRPEINIPRFPCNPLLGGIQEATNQCFSLSLPSFLSVKAMKKMSSGEDKK